MPVLTAPGAIKVVVTGDNQGEPWVNILHWVNPSYLGPVDPAAASDSVAAAVNGIYHAEWAPFADPGADYTSTTAFWLGSASSSEHTYSTPTGGSASPPAAPLGSAGLVTYKIPTRYRGGKPRTYVAGVSMNFVVNGRELTGAGQTALQNFATALQGVTISSGGTWSMGCVHYTRGHAVLNPPQYDVFQEATAQLVLASQRRRLHRAA